MTKKVQFPTKKANAMAKQAVDIARGRSRTRKPVQGLRRKGKNPQVAGGMMSGLGPIATIDTAPVSIGSTVSGCKPIVIPILDGVRVKARDYLLSIDSTAAAITGWTLVGAAPLTPACMVSSSLKGYGNTYAEYYVHGMSFHYITTASTTETGAMMFCIFKDRHSPGAITSSANFLPMVLSDHGTILGPLWKNNTAMYCPEPMWYPTDILNDEDLNHQACGELMVFTRTAVTDSPGYVLIDYDISFRELQVNIKSLTLPVSRMKYTQVLLSQNAFASTAHITFASFGVGAGTLMDGVTVSSFPPGAVDGDVYKVIMNISNSVFINAGPLTLLEIDSPTGAFFPVLMTDGFTCYAVKSGILLTLYPDFDAAKSFGKTAGNNMFFAITNSITADIPAYISLCGSVGTALAQANY